MVVDVHRILTDPTRASEDPSVLQLQSLDRAVRDAAGRYLLDQVESVAAAKSRVHACREWVIREAKAYAPIRVLFVDAAGYEAEVAAGLRHPCTHGLFERINEVVTVILADRVSRPGETVESVVEQLRKESLWLHLRQSLANLGRCALDDIEDGGQNWLHAHFNRLVAREEINLRNALGWEIECDAISLDREIALIEGGLLSNDAAPLADYRAFLAAEAEIGPAVADVAATVMRLQISAANRYAAIHGRDLGNFTLEIQAFAFGLLAQALEGKGMSPHSVSRVVEKFCELYLPGGGALLPLVILNAGRDENYRSYVQAGKSAMLRFQHNPHTEATDSDIDDLAFALGVGDPSQGDAGSEDTASDARISKSTRDLINSLKRDAEVNGTVDWRHARDEIHSRFDSYASQEERVLLLEVFKAIMDAMERTLTDEDDFAKFRETRRQDYNLLLIKECLVGEDVSVEALAHVTKREVEAGRMPADDEMRSLAITQLGQPHLTQRQLIEKWTKKKPGALGWRNWFNWM